MTTYLDTSAVTNEIPFFKKQTRLTKNLRSVDYFVFIIISISLLLRLYGLSYNNLLAEESYYWNYAQHLDFGYLDHPPMVAVLIKITSSIFGTHEFGVRIASLLCWMLTGFFSFKLTNLITRGTGKYALMLLAILPFFFLHSMVITPDQPLIVCWSAALYCLYRSLVLDERHYWYGTGIWLGLGLLSKYTIVLLGPATLLFLCITPSARPWLRRKEPYLCALITTVLFTPVIYWNATHEWASFVFQSTRRLEATPSFSFHHLIGILVFFVMPAGIISLWTLMRKNVSKKIQIVTKSKRFIQVFTLFPLAFFGVFSFSHEIKFNWIGPGCLALIPWIAILISNTQNTNRLNSRRSWFVTSFLLLFLYSGSLFVITQGTPERTYQQLFRKFIAWDNLTQQVHDLAKRIEDETHMAPIIVPLDLYNLNSEFSFYQEKFLAQGDITKRYRIIGRHIFGIPSLMYYYWSDKKNLSGKTLIVISKDRGDLDNAAFRKRTIEKSPIQMLWSHSQVHLAEATPYYYQIVEMNPYQ